MIFLSAKSDGYTFQQAFEERTARLLAYLSKGHELDAKEALYQLAADLTPISERLCNYISTIADIENTPESVRAYLKQTSAELGLGFTSANLSQWLTAERMDIQLSELTMFKLCLAMRLDPEQCMGFVYDCLHQSWFNFRTLEGQVFSYFLCMQDLFGAETCHIAQDLIARKHEEWGNLPASGEPDATGFTNILKTDLLDVVTLTAQSGPEKALSLFETYLDGHMAMLTGFQHSARRVYRRFLTEGGVGLPSLAQLYRERTGLVLPETSYLDMSNVSSKNKYRRLLWGAANRTTWLNAGNSSDWDILTSGNIRLEHHAVERMMETGVLRGNILALLFFHFCFEHDKDMTNADAKRELFTKFYNTTNRILMDECGMMPLHPRKPFDRLFLQSLASSGNANPVDYLNSMLEHFYQV